MLLGTERLALVLSALISQVCYAYLGDVAKGIRKETACDGYELTMLCPATDLIHVELARYGRQDDLTCAVDTASMGDTHCSLSNALDLVSKKCNGKSGCIFTVGQHNFPDPCPGTSKYVTVMWYCVPTVVSCPGLINSVSLSITYVMSRKTNRNSKADGAWVRDPVRHTQRIYYMGYSRFGASTLYEYSSTQSFLNDQPSTFYHLQHVDGTSFAVSDGFVYYNAESSRSIVKYNLEFSKVAAEVELPNANYHNTSPYAVQLQTDIDVAVDENGLWVIYATEGNNGNIVLSRLQKQTLHRLNTWHTSYEKLSALNAFVACGVLYVVNYDSLEIDYIYNTTSNTEAKVHIPIPGLNKTTSAIEYNPKDRMLYVWDMGVPSMFKITFDSNDGSSSSHPSISKTPSVFTTSTLLKTPSKTPKIENPNHSPPLRTTPSSLHHPKRQCIGRRESGLLWPNTSYSEVAILNCLGSSPGKAIWICGGSSSDPQWTTSHPDLSQCLSVAVKTLKRKMNSNETPLVDLCQSFSEKLLEREETRTSWDLIEVVRLLKRCVRESSTDRSSASAIADAVLKTTSLLLRPALAPNWMGLDRDLQTGIAVSLASVLEEAAFFLAQDMTSSINRDVTELSSQSNSVTWSQSYATMAIRIEPVLKSTLNQNSLKPTPSPTTIVTHNSGHGDTVVLSDQSISEGLGAQPGQKLAIVYLSLKHIGKQMVDSSGFGSGQYPVDSRLLSVSAKSMDAYGEWMNRGRKLNLTRPIRLHLWHSRNDFSNHVCAFWDEKRGSRDGASWSRFGCRRVSGNNTHSVCDCNHLTSFAVLSSNEEFPAMGIEPGWVAQARSSEFLAFLNVVRGGMIVSFIFLVMTFAALLHIKNPPDLNTIHKNLIASLGVTELVFLSGITAVANQQLCTLVAVLLHYGVLCIFTWAALEAFHHLAALTHSWEANNRWKYYYGIGYVFPAVIVGISALVDHSAFGTQAVCWVRTSDSFIWVFVGPCCLAIATSVVLIAILLYKLNRDRLTCADDIFRNIRSDAAVTCLTMFLLCMMWSSSFMWIAGFQVGLTAWLFSFFSASSGVGSFILYFIVSPYANLVRRRFNSCFVKESNTAHPSLPQELRRNTPLYPDYPGQIGNPLCPTLLASDQSPSSTLSKVANGVDIEMQPLMLQGPSRGFADHVIRGGIEYRRSTIDVTDPKLPSSQPYLLSRGSWNDYVRKKSMSLAGNASTGDPRVGNVQIFARECSNCPGPHPGQYCACNMSTYKSGCYDRLHDDPPARGGAQRNLAVCDKCQLRRMPKPLVARPRPVSHQYETLGPFFDDQEDGENAPIRGYHLSRRHPYEEIDSNRVQVHAMMAPPNPSNIRDFLPNHPSNVTRLNDVGMRTDPVKRSSRMDPSVCRSGRQSDPLSTDQGYDTDSQQPSQILNHSSHGEELFNRNSPYIRGLGTPLGPLNERRRKNSMSGESDSVSENDREVETINYSTAQELVLPTSADAQQGYVTSAMPSPLPLIESREESVERTPRISDDSHNAFDTVKSWSAITGSHLKSSYHENGPSRSTRKSTVDPHVIIAQARQKSIRNSFESCGSGGSEDKPMNGYTLPGTAASGTKARIDLRSGGVSMTTNL